MDCKLITSLRCKSARLHACERVFLWVSWIVTAEVDVINSLLHVCTVYMMVLNDSADHKYRLFITCGMTRRQYNNKFRRSVTGTATKDMWSQRDMLLWRVQSSDQKNQIYSIHRINWIAFRTFFFIPNTSNCPKALSLSFRSGFAQSTLVDFWAWCFGINLYLSQEFRTLLNHRWP